MIKIKKKELNNNRNSSEKVWRMITVNKYLELIVGSVQGMKQCSDGDSSSVDWQ